MENYQKKLFDLPQHFTNGLVYRPDFITPEEEELLLVMVEHLPMERVKHQIQDIGESVLVRRRAAWFKNPIPRWLVPLQRKVAKWLDVPRERVPSVLINEYQPGMGMGFHRDKDEDIEHVIGISLGARATMQFRPYTLEKASDIISLELEPRSAYIMQKKVHHSYQHRIVPVTALRYSLTFRTTLQKNNFLKIRKKSIVHFV